MNLPNVTQAQLLALVTWLGGQSVAYGVLTPKWEKLALSTTATVIAVAWKVADSIIRHGRSRALAPPPVAPGPQA